MEPLDVDEARLDQEKGDDVQARRRLRQILRNNPQNTAAWLLFAELAVNDLQRVYCLEQVLLLDEQNVQARQWLGELRRQAQVSLFEEPVEADQASSTSAEAPRVVPPFEAAEVEIGSDQDLVELPLEPTLEVELDNSSSEAEGVEKNCPFIGLAHDRMSLTAFPSSENVCYRVTPPKGVSQTYQQSFCLSVNHVNCDLLKMPRKRGSLLSVLISKAEKGK